MAGPFDYPQAQMYPPTVQQPRRLPPSPYGGRAVGFSSGTSVAGSGLPPIYKMPGGGMPPTSQGGGGTGVKPPTVAPPNPPTMPPVMPPTSQPPAPPAGQYVDMGYGNSGIYQNGMELYRPPSVSVDPGPTSVGGGPGFEGGPTAQGRGHARALGGDPRYWLRGKS